MKFFSQRLGFEPAKSVIQKDNIDAELKDALWSALYVFYLKELRDTRDSLIYHSKEIQLAQRLWFYYFKQPLDLFKPNGYWFYQYVREHFYKAEWHKLYHFIEVIMPYSSDEKTKEDFSVFCNEILQNELSAYRIISGQVTPITDSEEIKTIDEAIEHTPNAAKHHLQQALVFFSDREKPDYRNSIKESISAVESICKQIAGDTKGELSSALKKIESSGNIKIHGAQKKAFEALYGWTSDDNGIRHALMEEPTLDAGDARYMLVTCSAFVNFLIEKSNKAGIKLS